MSNAQKVSDERLARMTWRNVAPHEIEAVITELQSLRAAPTPDAHSEVGVKALAWEQKSEFWCRAESGMEHLPYTITDGASYGRRDRRLARRLALGNVTIETYNNDDEAKIAADAHHRQRILSCLTAGVAK